MSDSLIPMQHASKASAGFSHSGESYDSDEDGIIEVPSHVTDHAKAHGFSMEIEEKVVKPLAKGGKKPESDDSKSGDGKGGK